MFNSADRRLYMAQKTYKQNYDKHVSRKTFKVGDFVFVNRPPSEARTENEKKDSETKSKLQARAYGPHKVRQVFENVLVLEEDGTLVPTSINRCSLAPPKRASPPKPNPEANAAPQQVHAETEALDTPTRNDLQTDATDNELHGNSPPFVVRIIEHIKHLDGRISYRVQLSDKKIDEADVNDLPYREVIRYWHSHQSRRKNPQLRKRGRPRKEKGGSNTAAHRAN